MPESNPNLIQRLAALALRITGALAFLAPLLTRLVIGEAFHLTGHGKLANLDKTTGFFASLNIPFPHVSALFVSMVEFACGAGLALGLLTPLCAALRGPAKTSRNDVATRRSRNVRNASSRNSMFFEESWRPR